MGILGFQDGFLVAPHPHSYEILTYFYDCSLPNSDSAEQTIEYRLREGALGWGTILSLFIYSVGKVKCSAGFSLDVGGNRVAIPTLLSTYLS